MFIDGNDIDRIMLLMKFIGTSEDGAIDENIKTILVKCEQNRLRVKFVEDRVNILKKTVAALKVNTRKVNIKTLLVLV